MTNNLPELCTRCGVHPAEHTVAESALDYAHGHYEFMCSCCATYEQLCKNREAVARIPQLEAELATACDRSGSPPPEIPFGWQGWEDTGAGIHCTFWSEELDDVVKWCGEKPGRTIGSRTRQPAWHREEKNET